MQFIKNKLTKVNECKFSVQGINMRFVQKKSKKLGIVVYFRNGKNAESYYDKNGVFVENSHGMAHFLEHLLFSSSSLKIDWLRKLQDDNVDFNGMTGESCVFYHICSPTQQMLDTSIRDLLKITYTLDIDDEIFEKEKGIVSTEVSMHQDSPTQLATNILGQYFGNSHLSHTITGTPDTVLNITKDEVIDYYKDVYTLENSEICVFADFEEDIELIDKVKNIVIDEINYIRENFDIHVQKTGYKRKVAYHTDSNFDKKVIKMETPSTSIEKVMRLFSVKYSSKDYLDIKSVSAFLNSMNQNVNPKIKDLYIEKGFSLDTSIELQTSLITPDEFYLLVVTSQMDRIDEICKFYEDIVKNYKDYDFENLAELSKEKQKLDELSQVDVDLSSIYMLYAYRQMDPNVEIFSLEDNKEIDNDYVWSMSQLDKVSNLINFDNYIDIIDTPMK